MNRLLKLLLALSVGLLVAGIGLAVAQPGSLGDDDGDDTASAVPDDTSGDPSDDSSGVTPDDRDIGDDDPTVETSTPPPTAGAGDGDGAGPTDTTAPSAAPSTTEAPTDSGSGLGSDGSGEEATSDDLADTGGPSLVVLGLALGLVGLTLRQRTS